MSCFLETDSIACQKAYTALHYTTLHYTTLHYTTLHYTTCHTNQLKTINIDGSPRVADDFQPRAQPKRAFSDGQESSKDFDQIQKFSVVEEKCVLHMENVAFRTQ